MMKFSFRNNNLYPLMLLLFIFLRISVEKILTIHPYKKNIEFVISFLIFFSQCLIGSIIVLFFYCKKNKEVENSRTSSSFTYNQISTLAKTMNISYITDDNKYKKFFLIIFTSFFNFIGSTIRNDDVINFGRKEENNSQLEIRIRSIQIIISSLLCHFTIRLKIYKHQKLSLIIISFFLLFLISMELYISSSIKNKILSMLICVMSCFSRALMDVTEKYLFDYDYINIFSMLVYEGLIGIICFIVFFFNNKNYQNEGKNILKDMSKFNWSLISFILLSLLYTIISGFKNAYRVKTNKYYSPMSRALFESTLDPFLFLYNFLTQNNKENKGIWIYFSLVVFSLSVIAFFSLVYNDFIILYCCGLEYNTYTEINKRINSDNKIQRKNTEYSIMDETLSEESEEEKTEEKHVMKNLK